MSMSNENNTVGYAAGEAGWNYVDIDPDPPTGKKIWILTRGGIAIQGNWDWNSSHKAWSLLLKQDKWKDQLQQGIRAGKMRWIEELVKGDYTFSKAPNANLYHLVITHETPVPNPEYPITHGRITTNSQGRLVHKFDSLNEVNLHPKFRFKHMQRFTVKKFFADVEGVLYPIITNEVYLPTMDDIDELI